jgi:16S rRNA (guanine966-N2)-methyltransferase
LAVEVGRADAGAERQLAGLSFLDLYAGSGAVGLEAVSRGARAQWVEQDRPTARLIERNLADLGVRGRVVAADVLTYLSRPGRAGASQFDLVWLDPPYAVASADVEKALGLLLDHDWLRPGGLVLVERSTRSSAVEFPESFLNIGARRYGETLVYHAERGE